MMQSENKTYDMSVREAAAFTASLAETETIDKCFVPSKYVSHFSRCDRFESLIESSNMSDILRSDGKFLFVICADSIYNIPQNVLIKIDSNFKPIHASEKFFIYSNVNVQEVDNMFIKSFKNSLRKLKTVIRNVHALSDIAHNLNRNPSTSPCYLGDNRVVLKTVYGHKLIVDSEDCSLAPHLIIDGYWEQSVTKVIRSLIKPGMRVLEIGPNVGYYSVQMADLAGADGFLHVFEANPSMAEICARNLEINGYMNRSKVEAKAVYNATTTISFNICKKHKGSSSIHHLDLENIYDEYTTLTVPAVKLDEYISSQENYHFWKIDAEGAEPYILEGAVQQLKRNNDLTICMEFVPAMLNGHVKKLLALFREANFQISEISHDPALPLNRIDDWEYLEKFSGADLILSRAS